MTGPAAAAVDAYYKSEMLGRDSEFEIHLPNRLYLSHIAKVKDVPPDLSAGDGPHGPGLLVRFGKQVTHRYSSDAHGGLFQFVKGMLGLSPAYGGDFETAGDSFETRIVVGRHSSVNVQLSFKNQQDADWVKTCLDHMQQKHAAKSAGTAALGPG